MSITPLYDKSRGPMRLAIFMSGSGSNAKKLIEAYLDDKKEFGKAWFEPVLMFTDNPNSNAVRIATEDYKPKGFAMPVFMNPIHGFYEKQGVSNIKDKGVRDSYDTVQLNILSRMGVDAIALAGYEWMTRPVLCNAIWTFNVHPGYLRVKAESGKPKYDGLAWVPSAKAILAGEKEVRTSVHIVTPERDCGPILSVSEPQPVPNEVLSLEDRTVLLGEAKSIQQIVNFIKEHPDISKDQLGARFPIYKHAADCQERLKVNGDWVVFPRTIRHVAQGRYGLDDLGRLYWDSSPTDQWLKK